MNDYTKGILTGASLILCLFMLVSAKSQSKNLGDITVKSISVLNNRGGAVIWIGSSPNDDGYLVTYNGDGKKTAYLGTGESGDGILNTFNSDGKLTAYLGTTEGGGGHLRTYNKHEVMIGYFGTGDNGETIIQDGMATLHDRYGEIGWGETGKK